MEAAAVVIENRTGAVRAMVGGWDFERNKFNRITQAKRQVGSAFKPFVYGAALEAGWTPSDTLLDAPTSFLGADGRLSYRPAELLPEALRHRHPAPRPGAVDQRAGGQAVRPGRRPAGDRLRPPLRHPARRSPPIPAWRWARPT